MQKLQFFFVFSLIFPHFGNAAGVAKRPYDLECPEDQKVTATRSGPVCTARVKLETDPTCTPEMAEELNTKQECYLAGNESSCVLLAVGVSATATGLAGQRAHKVSQSLLQKASQKSRDQIRQVFNEIRNDRNMERRAQQKYYQILNAQTPRLTANKYKTFNALLKAYRYAQTGNNPNPEINERFEVVREHTKKVYKEAIANEPDPELKKYMQDFDPHGDNTQRIHSRLVEKMKQIFPKEAKELQKPLDEIESLERQRRRERQNGMKDPFTESQYQNSIQKLETALEKSPKLKMFYSLQKNAFSMAQNSKLGRAMRAQFSQDADVTMGEDARVEAMNSIKSKRWAQKATIHGGLFGAIVGTAELAGGQVDIRTCREHFGINDEELKILGNDSIFTVSKAHKQHGWTCDSLALTDPQDLFAELEIDHGGIPKGICKIAQAQLKKLNDLVDRIGMNPNVACLKQTDVSVAQYADSTTSPQFLNNEGKPVFEYKEKSLTYVMPLRPNSSYPDFKLIKVLNSKGKEVHNQSLALQKFYNVIHPSSVFELSPELADISLIGYENSSNGNLFSNIASASFQMRVNSLTARGMCSLIDSPQETQTPKTKNSSPIPSSTTEGTTATDR